MAGWMTIELKGLRFFAEHGMYVEERKVGNQFEIDLEVSYKVPKHTITTMEETVNYVEIYRIVEERFLEYKNLLETCAMEICEALHEQFSEIRKISISIKKINPPITNLQVLLECLIQKSLSKPHFRNTSSLYYYDLAVRHKATLNNFCFPPPAFHVKK